MSANNYMLIHKLQNRWHIWDNLNAEEAVQNEILGSENSTVSFDTLEEAVEWANQNDETEYGYQINKPFKPKDGYPEEIYEEQI